MDKEIDAARPGYFAVIPADVRYDRTLPPNAKLLYGEISALIGKDGFCYANNGYFAALYGCTELTITRLIGALVDAGYIVRQVIKDASGKVVRRKLWLKVSMPDIQPPIKNDGTPYQKNQEGTIKNDRYINTSNTNIKAPSEKRSKASLTDEQLKTLSEEWIREHGGAWPQSAQEALLAALCDFYAPRETKKKTPGRTKASFKAMTNRLLRYAGDDPEAMQDMLERATTGKWLTVYPTGDEKQQEPGGEEGEKWI